jgi:hypothetical protein
LTSPSPRVHRRCEDLRRHQAGAVGGEGEVRASASRRDGLLRQARSRATRPPRAPQRSATVGTPPTAPVAGRGAGGSVVGRGAGRLDLPLEKGGAEHGPWWRRMSQTSSRRRRWPARRSSPRAAARARRRWLRGDKELLTCGACEDEGKTAWERALSMWSLVCYVASRNFTCTRSV